MPPAVVVAAAFQCGDTGMFHAKHTSLQPSMTRIIHPLTLQYCFALYSIATIQHGQQPGLQLP